MLKRLSLTCALVWALTTTSFGQVYEYSGSSKPGLHAASLEETLHVLRQITGLNNMVNLDSAQDAMDVPGSYRTLAASATAPLRGFVNELGISSPFPHFFIVAHAEGLVAIHLDDRGSVLRFASTRKLPNLYVRKIADAPPQPKIEIDPDVLEMVLKLLTPDQRLQVMDALRAINAEQVDSEKSTVDSLLNSEQTLFE